MADFETERRRCLRDGWRQIGEQRFMRSQGDLPEQEWLLRRALWRLMVGSHSKAQGRAR